MDDYTLHTGDFVNVKSMIVDIDGRDITIAVPDKNEGRKLIVRDIATIERAR